MLFKIVRTGTISRRREVLATNLKIEEAVDALPEFNLKRKTSFLSIEEQKSVYKTFKK